MHRHRFIDGLPIGGRIEDPHRLVRADAPDFRRDLDRLAEISRAAAGLEILNRHASRGLNIGPRHDDAADGFDRVFRREEFITGEQRDGRQQHVAKVHQPTCDRRWPRRAFAEGCWPPAPRPLDKRPGERPCARCAEIRS